MKETSRQRLTLGESAETIAQVLSSPYFEQRKQFGWREDRWLWTENKVLVPLDGPAVKVYKQEAEKGTARKIGVRKGDVLVQIANVKNKSHLEYLTRDELNDEQLAELEEVLSNLASLLVNELYVYSERKMKAKRKK